MIRKIALAAILFLLSGPASGQLPPRCTLSTTGVAFGEIQFTNKTDRTATGAIVISCVGAGNLDYVLRLDAGLNSQYHPRQMPLAGGTGANNLPYNLYSETTLTSIWGNGTSGTVLVSGRFGNGPVAIVPVPVYGRVEARTVPTAGDYGDIVIATLGLGGGATNTSIPLNVTAHVANTCTLSATNLNFADYNQAQLDGQSQIHLVCTDDTPYQVGLDGGRFPGALTSRRSMSGTGLSQLNYQLYSDPARTTVWGNNVGSDTVPGTGNGLPQTLNVYGRIPAGQNVRDGGYVDTIVATVTF